MEKTQVLKQFWNIVYANWQSESLDKLQHQTPSMEELQLLEHIFKLPKEKQEMWVTAFKVIWEFDPPGNRVAKL